MMGKQEKRVLTLDRYEHGVVVNALNEMRNDLLEEERPTDIVDEVLLKVIDAPRRRGLRSLVSPASERKLDHSVAPPLPTKSDDFVGTPYKYERDRDEERYALLFIRGERPVMDEKYDILKHPNIALTEDGGAAPYEHGGTENAVATLSFAGIAAETVSVPNEPIPDYELLSDEDIEALF